MYNHPIPYDILKLRTFTLDTPSGLGLERKNKEEKTLQVMKIIRRTMDLKKNILLGYEINNDCCLGKK